MNRNVSWLAVTGMLLSISDEERQVLVDHRDRFKKFAHDLHAEVVANTYAVAVSDDEAAHWLVQRKKYGETEARKIVDKWRIMANNYYGYSGPVAWKIREGFIFLQHAPLAGPCYRDLSYMQESDKWSMKNDEATKESLVFWIPRLAEGSGHKNIKEKLAHRVTLRSRYKLPHHHCVSFGSIGLLFALTFANHKRTKALAPLHNCYAISDTLLKDGSHLSAGIFGEAGLHCDPWHEELRAAEFKFFLIGEEFPNK